MDTPTIPGYDILAPLPQGGMSAVFKARQISLDRVVVLKILPLAMAADGVDIEKLLAEAKITAQLKHPNMVQVYDFGKSPDGIYYFVMEFVSGYSVADWIRRKTSLSVKDTLLCAHCVAEALDYAWGTFGVVHCDIKPDNVIIDGDGTVKVADLGLARSVRSVMDKAKFQTGIVVGTPYYISPEQSQGRLELDCRTDIYSLGAMLYHCLTGKMPFEGLPLLEIMDCQITDQIPDIMDLQPHASMAVACLIEKMMAKNPAHRQKDWPEVIRDMIRARLELFPEGPMPPAGTSTMKRCVAREQYLKELDASAGQVALTSALRPDEPVPYIITRPRQWIKPEWLAAVIMILALAVPCLLVMNMLVKPKSAATPQNGGQTTDGGLSAEALAKAGRKTAEDGVSGDTLAKTKALAAPTRLGDLPGQLVPPKRLRVGGSAPAEPELAKEEVLAQHRIEVASQWYQANPGQYNEAIQQFTKIAAQSKGTRYAQAAEDEIAHIREQKRAALAADMKALHDKVQPLLDRHKWREAATMYEQYVGRFQTETMAERNAKVQEWLDLDRAQQTGMRQAAEAQKQEQRRQWQDVLNDIAARLLDGNPGAALAVAQQATNQVALNANRSDLLTLASMLAEAGRADQRLLDSFRSQKDQEVCVALTRGSERLVIRDVQDNSILVEKITVVSAGQIVQPKVIRLQDLSLEEKKARLGTNTTPDTALVHGLVALRDGNLAAAETFWSQAGPFLSAPLKAKLQERKSRQREEQARSDFILLLRAAQVDAVGVSGEALAKTETPASAEPDLAPGSERALRRGEKAEPLPGCEVCLAAIYRKKYPPPMAKVLAKSVASYQEQYGQTAFVQAYAPALAALQQATVIASDSNETTRIETVSATARTTHPDGAAVRQELLDRNPGLTEFNISLVTDDAGKIVRAELIALDLKDISPLAGLPDLRAVVCAVTRLDEWHESPVKAPLSDLAPLKGLPLREVCVRHTRVKDLAPLTGMPLTKLNLAGTRVTDLSVLKGMPLQDLTLSRLTIRDMKPLAGLPLESLNISYTEVSDLAPLTGMKLKRLIATASRIRDITVLAGMPLTELIINRTEVADLSPLKGIKLDHLDLSQTRVRDLTPLANMPLRGLNLSKTNIRDLSPVRSLALEMLNVRATRVKDLDPLRDMPLKWLDISESAVRDLSPIQNSPIEEIWLDYNINQQMSADTYRAFTAVLLRMPRLQKVNGKLEFQERRWRE
ncbi:MAG: protein kinase [Verrucomicrobia bacterium]|nr:protein kinase [Verrucomicrobiota bacterium]MBU1736450.1 protein kinase [Verrucomicrobiota bacterium]MBU1857217.1 protein kinase [Verrucomicrobiota bacterium]